MSFRSRSRRALRQPLRAKRLRFEPLEDRRLLTITVDSIGDASAVNPSVSALTAGGQITLRSAIQAANAGLDNEIDFSSSLVIEPGTSLPAITQNGVTIDGGGNVTIDGTTAGGYGLVINASDCTIEGLTIQDFADAGVKIDGTASVHADDNIVRNSIITGNGVGIIIVGDDESRDTADLELKLLVAPVLSIPDIDSTSTGNDIIGNQIKNNKAQGVLIQHASTNTVSGNTIGGNGTEGASAGIEIVGLGEATVTTFRGDEDHPELPPDESYAISNSATGNVIIGNWIGIDDNDTNIGNTGEGILINGASLTRIGGTETGQGNYISNNTRNGVRVTGAAVYAPVSSLLSSPSSIYGGTFAERRQTLTAVMAAVAANLGESESFSMQSLTETETTTMQQWNGAVAVYNRIQSNFISANDDGDAVAYNDNYGVLVEQAARVTIIGAEVFEEDPVGGNHIVGNAEGGVKIVGNPLNEHFIVEPANNYLPTPSDDEEQDTYSLGMQDFENNDTIFELVPTIVAGNWIGITAEDLLLGNKGNGVFVENSRAVVLQNFISGNGDDENIAHGVEITGTPLVGGVFGSIVSANMIGTKTDGTVTLNEGEVAQGNWGDGIFLHDGVQFSFVGALPPSPDQTDHQAAVDFRNIVSGNRGWGIHISGLIVPGQDRGIFHAEPFRDPFLFPEELRTDVDDDPEKEKWEVKPYGTVLNYVLANHVGVDESGALPAANSLGGVLVDDAAVFTVVGAWDVDLDEQFYANVISANDGPGVSITGQGTSVTVVGGNIIGLSATGGLGVEVDLGNDGPGVAVTNGALATNIGGDVFASSLGSRNYIAGNHGPGILIQDVFDLRRAIYKDVPEGHTIGEPINALTNLTTGAINTAAWDEAFGDGANYFMTAIVSNWIGLGVEIGYEDGIPDSWTPLAIGNDGDGIEIIDSSNTMIGANHPLWGRNTISANAGNGISITGEKSFLTFILQDFIGTTPDGTAGTNFGNGENGVLIAEGSHHNIISGTGPGRGLYEGVLTRPGTDLGDDFDPAPILEAWELADLGNVISGNLGAGIRLDNADYNRIRGGNFIGTNFGGTTAVPNHGSGVLITAGSTFNEIAPGMRADRTYFGEEFQDWREVVVQDVISGNLGAGVTIEGVGSIANSIRGTLIGVGYESDNMIGLGNQGPGVLIRDSADFNNVDLALLALILEPPSNMPGTIEPVFRKNVIVANGTTLAPRAGIEITGTGTTGNQVYNSFIGTNEDEATTLGNTGDGVLITASASANYIGDEDAGNVIAKNTASGVAIRGVNQAIVDWSIDEFGYLYLELSGVQGIAVDQHLVVSGFTIFDDEENSFPVTEFTVVSIVGNVVKTNVLVTLTGTPGASVSAAYVVMENANENVIRDNWIGTNEAESDLGNTGNGVLVTGSGELNWVTDNRIAFNGGHGVALTAGAMDNVVGTKIVSAVTLGAGNVITDNVANGVLITGATYNTLRANTISDNEANGVLITAGSKRNVLLANEITSNDLNGVLIANGAEGNGVGININGAEGATGTPVAVDPIGANTLAENDGYQVQIDGAYTYFNFVTGGNTIVAGAEQTAVMISNDAWDNVVGNGGEGYSDLGTNPSLGYFAHLLAYGNSITYGVDGTGISAVANGAEGSALVGNRYAGDLDSAIVLNATGASYLPPAISATVSAGVMTIEYNAQTTTQGLMRLDFYLFNPSTGEMKYVHALTDYDPASGLQDFDWTMDSSLTSLDGWYLSATATYKLQTGTTSGRLKRSSVTSRLATPIAF